MGVIRINDTTEKKIKTIGKMGNTLAEIVEMLTEFYLQNKDKSMQQPQEPIGDFKEAMVPATGRIRLKDFAKKKIRVYEVKPEE